MRIFPTMHRLSQLKHSSKSRIPSDSPAPIRLKPTPSPNRVEPVCLLGIASICLTHHPELGRILGYRQADERSVSTEYVFGVSDDAMTDEIVVSRQPVDAVVLDCSDAKFSRVLAALASEVIGFGQDISHSSVRTVIINNADMPWPRANSKSIKDRLALGGCSPISFAFLITLFAGIITIAGVPLGWWH